MYNRYVIPADVHSSEVQYVLETSNQKSWNNGFLISAAIHWLIILLLLIAWLSYQESEDISKSSFCLVVDKDPIVHIVEKPVYLKAVQPKTRPKKTVTRSLPPPAPPIRSMSVKKPEPVVKKAPPPPPPPPKPAVPQVSLRDYIEGLKLKIQANQEYPDEALEDRIEGSPQIGFDIVKSGAIENIRIVKSSGSEILDNDALDTLTQTSPYEPIPESLMSRTRNGKFEFELPLEYRIQ